MEKIKDFGKIIVRGSFIRNPNLLKTFTTIYHLQEWKMSLPIMYLKSIVDENILVVVNSPTDSPYESCGEVINSTPELLSFVSQYEYVPFQVNGFCNKLGVPVYPDCGKNHYMRKENNYWGCIDISTPLVKKSSPKSKKEPVKTNLREPITQKKGQEPALSSFFKVVVGGFDLKTKDNHSIEKFSALWLRSGNHLDEDESKIFVDDSSSICATQSHSCGEVVNPSKELISLANKHSSLRLQLMGFCDKDGNPIQAKTPGAPYYWGYIDFSSLCMSSDEIDALDLPEKLKTQLKEIDELTDKISKMIDIRNALTRDFRCQCKELLSTEE